MPLSVVAGKPELGRVVQPQPTNRWTRSSDGALKPTTLSGVLKDAQGGDLERWADTSSYMIRTDPHVRSVWLTRVMAVASATFEVRPGRAKPGMEPIAEAAAEFCRVMLEDTEELEDRFADLLHGVAFGVAALEHDWKPRGGMMMSTPRFIHPRDLRYVDDWALQVRTYTTNVGEWIDIGDHPDKFLVHAPHQIAETPTLTGELMAVAWPWLFKRWLEKYRLSGLERIANGLMYGVLPPNATATARSALQAGLEDISADGVAIFEDGVSINLLESTKNPGEAWTKAIESLNNEISKGLLGSGLNVDVGSVGSRALGTSQFDTTILPRLVNDAKRLAGTVERDWFAPALKFNSHLFGGQVPPTPNLSFTVVQEESAEADWNLLVQAGAVTQNELRVSVGLEPIEGGDALVTAPSPAPGPMFSDAPGGGPADTPLSRPRPTPRPTRRLTSTGVTRTSAVSLTRGLKAALLGQSDDQGQ